MINILMQIVAVIAGALVGTWAGLKIADFALMWLYHRRFRNKQAYDDLYGSLDTEDNFEFFKHHNRAVNTYAKYLKLHQKAQNDSLRLFSSYYSETARFLAVRLFGALLIAVLFWANWYWYVLAMLFTFVGLLVYKRYIRRLGKGYYTNLMLTAVLKRFLTENLKW